MHGITFLHCIEELGIPLPALEEITYDMRKVVWPYEENIKAAPIYVHPAICHEEYTAHTFFHCISKAVLQPILTQKGILK